MGEISRLYEVATPPDAKQVLDAIRADLIELCERHGPEWENGWPTTQHMRRTEFYKRLCLDLLIEAMGEGHLHEFLCAYKSADRQAKSLTGDAGEILAAVDAMQQHAELIVWHFEREAEAIEA